MDQDEAERRLGLSRAWAAAMTRVEQAPAEPARCPECDDGLLGLEGMLGHEVTLRCDTCAAYMIFAPPKSP